MFRHDRHALNRANSKYSTGNEAEDIFLRAEARVKKTSCHIVYMKMGIVVVCTTGKRMETEYRVAKLANT